MQDNNVGTRVMPLRGDAKSNLISRNITIMGRRTSIRLEPQMWSALKEIAEIEKCSVHSICALVDYRKNLNSSLTAAIRVFIMLYFKSAATAEGHQRAGHGDFKTMARRARTPLHVLGLEEEEDERKSA